MDQHPKKSRALIITIIAIIILLIVGYFLFFRSNQNYGIKSSSTTTSNSTAANSIRDFVSLIFKPKTQQTTTTVVTTSTQPTTTTGTDTTNSISSGNGLGTNTGLGAGAGISAGTGTGANSGYTAALQPLPTPVNNGGPVGTTTPTTQTINPFPQCSDGTDNNGNGLVDIQEPGCHSDFNSTNTTSYDPSLNDESRVSPSVAASNANQCPSDDPLVFTATEQAKLADLLNQYYSLAPELKTSDDLALLSDNITSDQSLIDQANSLIAQCNSEKADPAYTGPQAVKDNPYYQNLSGSVASYLPGILSDWITVNSSPDKVSNPLTSYSDFEKKFSIW